MKKLYSFLAAMLLVSMSFMATAQTIVGWSFPATTTTDTVTSYKATAGIPANINVTEITSFTTAGQTYPANSFATFKTATNNLYGIVSDGFHGSNPANPYCWILGPISTKDAPTALSMEYKTKGSKTGPAYWNIDYRIGTEGEWINIHKYTIGTTALIPVTVNELPKEITNQENVYIRIAVANNRNITGVTSSKIGDTVKIGGNNYLFEVYINALPAAEPTFSVDGGKFYAPIKVGIAHPDSTAAIYYTLDGTTPVVADSLLYKDSIEISATTTIKAIAVVAGLAPSKVIEATYKFPHPSVAFKGLENGGQYLSPLHLNVDVIDFDIANDKGVGDGYVRFESPVIDVLADQLNEELFAGEPVVKNPFYCDAFLFETMPEFPIELKPGEYTATVALVDLDSNLIDSTLMQTITFTVLGGEIDVPSDTIIFLNSDTLPIPLISKNFADSLEITVTITDTLFTSVEKTLPVDTLCFLNLSYVGPTDTVVYANLILSCGDVVDTIVLNYGLGWDTCAAPTFSIAEGSYKEAQVVEINCATPNCAIFYTTDGTKPTSLAHLYTEPIHVDSSMTIMAFAVAVNHYNSEVAIAKYIIEKSDVGINENEIAGVKVYPNPTTSYINIELGNVNAKRVDVIAANGQIVYTTTAVENNVQVSFDGCAKGMYFVRVATNNNEIIVKKVMKM